MRKKTEINAAEKALFRDTVRKVKPLTHTKVALKRPTPINKVSKPVNPKEEVLDSPFSDYESLDPVSGEDLLEFTRPGIQHKVLRKLRTGQYNVEAILDLHGKTVMEAKESLQVFLQTCQERDVRHTLIIHGKGHGRSKPILKNKLNHWLRQTEQVLAFCSATIKDGRSGAMYVLLKRGSQS